MEVAEVAGRVERVSQVYARTVGVDRDPDWCVLKLQEELGELVAAHLAVQGRARDRGRSTAELRLDLQRECADVLAHVLLLARALDVDLEAALAEKWWPWLEDEPVG